MEKEQERRMCACFWVSQKSRVISFHSELGSYEKMKFEDPKERWDTVDILLVGGDKVQ